MGRKQNLNDKFTDLQFTDLEFPAVFFPWSYVDQAERFPEMH